MAKVVVKEVGKALKVVSMELNLKSMQDVVKGYIEMPYITNKLSNANIDMVINEEGKLIGLEENIIIMQDGKVVDVIVGNVLFTSYDEEGKSLGLSDEQIFVIQGIMDYGLFGTKDGLMPLGIINID